MSTSEASKNGKKPTSVGPPEGSRGSHTSPLENHNGSCGDHKSEDKSSKGSENKKKQTSDGQPGGSRGSNSDADNRGSSSSSEKKHDISVSHDKQIPAAKESKDKNVELEHKKKQEADTYGPWGGESKRTFDHKSNHTRIRKIEFSESTFKGSKYIAWITVYYDDDDDGKTTGGKGDDVAITRTINFPINEVLTHISGCYGPLSKEKTHVIRSLTFHTTKTNYGPYGDIKDVAGTIWRFPPANEQVEGVGKVVGIHGRTSRSSTCLYALGVYVMKGSKIPLPPSSTEQNIGNAQPPAANQVNEPPSWDDGSSSSGIKQIKVKRAPKGIASIKIGYAGEKSEDISWKNNHGKDGSTPGDEEKTIVLKYPKEKLTHISGTFGSISKDDQRIIIKSLTFHTTCKPPHDPIAGTGGADEEVGVENTFKTSRHPKYMVVGFHGRSDDEYLVDIGVHMK